MSTSISTLEPLSTALTTGRDAKGVVEVLGELVVDVLGALDVEVLEVLDVAEAVGGFLVLCGFGQFFPMCPAYSLQLKHFGPLP